VLALTLFEIVGYLINIVVTLCSTRSSVRSAS
jgi:hypothetical protein